MVALVKIEWNEGAIPLRLVDDVEDGDFYAILIGQRDGRNAWTNIRLSYIGQAYRQLAATRVKQVHQSYSYLNASSRRRPDDELLVTTANIVEVRGATTKVTS